MRVRQVKVGALSPAAYNPRRIGEEELEALTRSVREFGLVAPIVANKDGTVIGGHQRLEAAKRAGLKAVPVVFVDLTPEEERTLNVALNRIRGDWDDHALARVLKGLREAGADTSLGGFVDHDVDRLIERLERGAPEEFPEVDESRPAHRCGSCGYEFD